MSHIEMMLVAGVAIPLVSFVLLALLGSRIGKPLSGWVATAAVAASCVLATIVLVQWHGLNLGFAHWPGMDEPARLELQAQAKTFVWANLGNVPLTVGVRLDGLTLVMFFMVSFVGTCIHVFSIGYMAGHSDEIAGRSKFHRFFTYMSLFCFSMLGLVLANSLLFLFIFWELVGLCSYLLIGFYFHKKSASNAAIKAFVTNRVGDLGFIIGLAMVFFYLGDLSLAGAAKALRTQFAENGPLFTTTLAGLNLATWMGILLFCGAIGKSAQFPLHVWLPDAMEGPTPVSALIHAATMVAAGVYLTARIFVLLTPQAQMFIAVIGCITLTLAALVAIVQTDIKKVLAYSTISQLGYMILGMGVGAWIGALFHLLTHAYFKALMFLGSGQVIEGCHHEQDMRKMGGLWRKMPVTAVTFLVGVLAIAGFGIPGSNLGLGGFFSKDEILAVAWHRAYGNESIVHEASARPQEYAGVAPGTPVSEDLSQHISARPQAHVGAATLAGAASARIPSWLFWIPVIMAYITPFYMMRAWWMTFMGRPREHHVYEHAHESALMYVPLIVLAAGTVFASYWLFRPMVAEAHPGDFLVASYDPHAHGAEHASGQLVDPGTHHALTYRVGFAFLIGFAAAILIYRKGLHTADVLARRLKPLHTLLEHKFYFDEVYGAVLVGGTMVLKTVAYLFDQLVIDGLVNAAAGITRALSWISGNVLDALGVDGLVNGIGRATWEVGGVLRRPQDGRIRNYILYVAGGTTAIVLIVVGLGLR